MDRLRVAVPLAVRSRNTRRSAGSGTSRSCPRAGLLIATALGVSMPFRSYCARRFLFSWSIVLHIVLLNASLFAFGSWRSGCFWRLAIFRPAYALTGFGGQALHTDGGQALHTDGGQACGIFSLSLGASLHLKIITDRVAYQGNRCF